ncbi:hypothetical protein CALCODRAFT_497572 [Calocera cornea HHB12733]|uniref:J domain-containing protein n=1 Tax=Calocera cornea HHB12733 TaxID=1353952 RepID=A0A165F643_9BASI|nr:hypothetical protein CALCODRAFT_497572 [Calocera cornea HHB12733]
MDWTEDDNGRHADDEQNIYAPETPQADEVDFYALLNVEKSASAAEIRESYHRLVIMLHPDKHPPEHREAAGKRFQDVTQAYEVLMDESKRRIYDSVGMRGLASEWAVGVPLRTAEEIRAQFELYNYRRAKAMAKHEFDTTTTVTVGLDARPLLHPFTGVGAERWANMWDDIGRRFQEWIDEDDEDVEEEEERQDQEGLTEKRDAALPKHEDDFMETGDKETLGVDREAAGEGESLRDEEEEEEEEEEGQGEEEEEQGEQGEEEPDEHGATAEQETERQRAPFIPFFKDLDKEQMEFLRRGKEERETGNWNQQPQVPAGSLISVSRLGVSHHTQLPITSALRCSMIASVGTHNNRGTANLFGTAEYQFRNRITLHAGSNLLYHRAPFVALTGHYGKTSLRALADFPTFFIPPVLSLTANRQLTPSWDGSIKVSSGSWTLPFWPSLDLPIVALDIGIDDDGELWANLVTRYSKDGQEAESTPKRDVYFSWRSSRSWVAAAVTSAFVHQPRQLFLKLSSTEPPGLPGRTARVYSALLQSNFKVQLQMQWLGWFSARPLIHRVLPIPSEAEALPNIDVAGAPHQPTFVSDKIGWKASLQACTLSGLSVSSSLSGRLGRASWGVSVDWGNTGVWLMLRAGTVGQKISVPIWLVDTRDTALAVSAFTVVFTTVMGCFTAHELWQLRNTHRRLKALREARADQLVQKRKEAEEVRAMLKDLVGRRTEPTTEVLVVTEALYGPKRSLKEDLTSAEREILDVTIPVQALVNNGRLHIPSGRRKSGLLGFYDAFPGEKKFLRIRYEHGGREYMVIVGDDEELSAPSELHALPL